MKLLSVLFFMAILLIGLTGCQVIPIGPDGKTDYANLTIQTSADIRAEAGIATSLALLAQSADKRPAVARKAYEVADAVDHVVVNGTIDIAQVNLLVVDLLKQWDSQDALVAGSILNSMTQLVQSKISVYYINATPSEQQQAVGAFIKSVCNGIKDSTLLYSQGLPLDANTGSFATKGKITVKPYVWTQPKK